MIFIDAHVHIYDCFDLNLFFNAAFENFRLATANIGAAGAVEGNDFFLLLAESVGSKVFTELHNSAGMPQVGARWQVENIEEKLSLAVSHKEHPEMVVTLVSGRQLITSEKLEYLALCTGNEFPDGLQLPELMEVVASRGGLGVCPWGVGKWLGRRGKLLGDQITSREEVPFFLGDNGGRPTLWPRPKFFRDGRFSGQLLSGSDPLPLRGEERRVGSFGCCFSACCDKENPAVWLRDQLLKREHRLTGFGSTMGFAPFLQNQLALRNRK